MFGGKTKELSLLHWTNPVLAGDGRTPTMLCHEYSIYFGQVSC